MNPKSWTRNRIVFRWTNSGTVKEFVLSFQFYLYPSFIVKVNITVDRGHELPYLFEDRLKLPKTCKKAEMVLRFLLSFA